MTEHEAFKKYKYCDDVTDFWEDQWTYCPVCRCVQNEEGLWIHESMKIQ